MKQWTCAVALMMALGSGGLYAAPGPAPMRPPPLRSRDVKVLGGAVLGAGAGVLVGWLAATIDCRRPDCKREEMIAGGAVGAFVGAFIVSSNLPSPPPPKGVAVNARVSLVPAVSRSAVAGAVRARW